MQGVIRFVAVFFVYMITAFLTDIYITPDLRFLAGWIAGAIVTFIIIIT